MTPDKHTIQEFFIEVGNGHELYVQEWGHKKAKTAIIFLHGGPGSGCSDKHKCGFDPSLQRVIFFDQRGAGRSLPHGSLEHNTTEQLVGDISKIADRLRLKQFVLTGGSWGACLALRYALQYSKRVKAMVLSGIFTGSQAEIDYFDKGEFRLFFPEAWERYLAATPAAHRKNPTKYHYQQVLSGKAEAAARASACAYANLEEALLGLDDRFTPVSPSDPAFDPASIKVEIFYLANRCFMPDRYILNNAHKLTMPIWIVQGRYDMVCPAITAHELHQKLPSSHLLWTIGGHRSEREDWSVKRALLLDIASDN